MNCNEKNLDVACAKFRKILEEQLLRIEDMKSQGDFTNYDALDTIKIGVCGGDGIGPIITAEAKRVLEFILDDMVKSGKVSFKVIDGFAVDIDSQILKLCYKFKGIFKFNAIICGIVMSEYGFTF